MKFQMLQILNKITGVGDPNRALVRTIALFKTAGLRDLSQSEPYLHTARMDSLEEVVQFYKDFSDKSRAGIVRNGAAELSGIALTDDDVTSLAAFLRALNEDYD
jgi:cytochrome c peroxidase